MGDSAYLSNLDSVRSEQQRRKQQRDEQMAYKSNFVKVEQKNISKQRQQQKNDATLVQYEAKYNQDAENRFTLEQQRNDRFNEQKEAQAYAQQQKEENRARLDAENRRKEAYRA